MSTRWCKFIKVLFLMLSLIIQKPRNDCTHLGSLKHLTRFPCELNLFNISYLECTGLKKGGGEDVRTPWTIFSWICHWNDVCSNKSNGIKLFRLRKEISTWTHQFFALSFPRFFTWSWLIFVKFENWVVCLYQLLLHITEIQQHLSVFLFFVMIIWCVTWCKSNNNSS